MAMLQARECKSGAEVLENVKRTRNYFQTLKPSGEALQIRALETELRAVKFDRDAYRAKCAALTEQLNILNLGRLATLAGPRTIERIQLTVCDFYGLHLEELLQRDRRTEMIMPRHIAMYLCRKLTTRSMPFIGQKFANRDHTTVLNAERKITRLMESDGRIKELVDMFTEKLTGGCE